MNVELLDCCRTTQTWPTTPTLSPEGEPGPAWFDPHLLGARLLVLCSSGVGSVGTVTEVSRVDLTLDLGAGDSEVLAADEVRRLWFLRPSAALQAMSAPGARVRVLRADRSTVVGRVLEELPSGGFRVLAATGVVEVLWLDVLRLEPSHPSADSVPREH